jgi:hypothetical protein
MMRFRLNGEASSWVMRSFRGIVRGRCRTGIRARTQCEDAPHAQIVRSELPETFLARPPCSPGDRGHVGECLPVKHFDSLGRNLLGRRDALATMPVSQPPGQHQQTHDDIEGM